MQSIPVPAHRISVFVEIDKQQNLFHFKREYPPSFDDVEGCKLHAKSCPQKLETADGHWLLDPIKRLGLVEGHHGPPARF